jgi:hypothetical protein
MAGRRICFSADPESLQTPLPFTIKMIQTTGGFYLS